MDKINYDNVMYGDTVNDLIIGIKKLESAMAYMISTYNGQWAYLLVPYLSQTTILGDMLTRIIFWTYIKCLYEKENLSYKIDYKSKSLFYTKYYQILYVGYASMLFLLDSVHLTKGECFFHIDNDYWVDLISNNKRKMVFNKDMIENFDSMVANIITSLIKDMLTCKYPKYYNVNFDSEICQLRKRKICDEKVFNFLASKYNDEVVEANDVEYSD